MKAFAAALITLGMMFPVCADALSLDVSQVMTEDETQMAASGKWDWVGERTEIDVKGQYIKSTGRAVKYDIGLLGKATFRQGSPLFGQAGYVYYHTHQAVQFALGVKGKLCGLHIGTQIEYPDGGNKTICGKAGVFYERKFDGTALSGTVDYIFDKNGDGRFDIEADAKMFFRFAFCGIGFSRIRAVEIQRLYVGVEF